MRLQFNPHDNEPVGLAGPILDAHDRWLVPPRFCTPDSPDCCMILKPHMYLTLHEVRDRHWLEFMRGHPDFTVVNRSNHPGV